MVTLMGHGHGAALANILIVSPVASGMLFYSNFSTLFSFHCIHSTYVAKMSEKCIYEKLLFFICSNMHRKRKLQCQGIKCKFVYTIFLIHFLWQMQWRKHIKKSMMMQYINICGWKLHRKKCKFVATIKTKLGGNWNFNYGTRKKNNSDSRLINKLHKSILWNSWDMIFNYVDFITSWTPFLCWERKKISSPQHHSGAGKRSVFRGFYKLIRWVWRRGFEPVGFLRFRTSIPEIKSLYNFLSLPLMKISSYSHSLKNFKDQKAKFKKFWVKELILVVIKWVLSYFRGSKNLFRFFG